MAAALTADAQELIDQIEDALSTANDSLETVELAAFSSALKSLVERYRAKFRNE